MSLFMIIVILLTACFLKGPIIDIPNLTFHSPFLPIVTMRFVIVLINEHDDDDDDDDGAVLVTIQTARMISVIPYRTLSLTQATTSSSSQTTSCTVFLLYFKIFLQ